MSKKTELNKQNKKSKPAPTGNPGTRDDNDDPEIKKVPTGNKGTFSIENITNEKLLKQ